MTKYYLIYWSMHQSTSTRVAAYEVFTTKAKRDEYMKNNHIKNVVDAFNLITLNASDFNDLMNDWSKKKDLDFIKYYPVQFH